MQAARMTIQPNSAHSETNDHDENPPGIQGVRMAAAPVRRATALALPPALLLCSLFVYGQQIPREL